MKFKFTKVDIIYAISFVLVTNCRYATFLDSMGKYLLKRPIGRNPILPGMNIRRT